MSDTDWREIEDAATAQLVSAVRAVREQHPDERIYGAMFHEFYGDGSVIYWPMLTVGTEESLAEVVAGYAARHGESDDLAAELRWSGPDLAHGFEPEDSEQAFADGVQVRASRSGEFEQWQRTYDRFLRCFPRAAKRARRQLIEEAAVSREFIAIAEDEAGELVPLSLTRAQMLKHFPQYDAAARERARLAALRVEQRVDELLPEAVVPTYRGPLIGEHEDLIVACGAAALPGLTRVVRGEEFPGGEVTAARLLAQINIDSPEVVEALDALMRREDVETNARAWAASALARMERSDLILARVPQLPIEVVARGITDPFCGFRDRGAHRSLDYAPLEAALNRHPHLESALEEELRPGSGYCALSADEIPTARAALDSPWNVVRTHARLVLEAVGASARSAE